jgi:glycosyltransferase involved in cell wall biosynthesis
MPWKIPWLVRSHNPFWRWRQDLYFRLQAKALRQQAAKIITVSLNTKEDIVEILNIPAERVSVIYEGVEDKFRREEDEKVLEKVKAKYNIFGPYLLYLGGFEPHKNVVNLLQAFGQTYTHNLKLVLAGGVGKAENNLKEAVRELGMQETVLFTGFIAEEDLPKIYSGAVLFLYPSLYEGFGFPPLEAMACGVPVIMAKTASLLEVGGGAVLYFDPENVNSIAGALQQALQLYINQRSVYEEWSLKCRQQASLFSWEKTARETLAVLESFRR